jgi:phenylacetate-CoA ligase
MSFKLAIQVLSHRRRLERSCAWTRARLESHQQSLAGSLRRFASERSPFYGRFYRGLDNRPLQDLPVLTKGMLMEHFDELVTDRSVRLSKLEEFLENTGATDLFEKRYVVLSTSGSTGRRGIFLFNKSEWVHVLSLITRPLVWSGMSPHPLRRRRAAMLASTRPWHYSSRVSESLSTPLLPSLRIDATEPLDRIVERLNYWKPELLAAYPSVLRPLAEEQLAGRLDIPVCYIATSAEVLTAETRRRVQQAWRARISDTYGCTEYAPVAAECPYGRKHLMEDSAIIEIVDHKGRRVPPGEFGDRVLVTVFHRFTQPLIRYEISDMLRPSAEACECGRPFQIIEAIDGRLEDVLRFPARDGSSAPVEVHPNTFHDLLEHLPVAGWQVIQDENALLILLVHGPIPGARSIDYEALARSVRVRLERDGASIPDIEVRSVAALPRGLTGKAPLVRRLIAEKLSASHA